MFIRRKADSNEHEDCERESSLLRNEVRSPTTLLTFFLLMQLGIFSHMVQVELFRVHLGVDCGRDERRILLGSGITRVGGGFASYVCWHHRCGLCVKLV